METLNNRLQKRIHASLYAILFLTILLGLSIILEGCADKCEVTNEYVYYEPVYTTLAEIRSAVDVVDAKPIKVSGKIYIKGHWLFVNEPGEGIHIIDNRIPASPQVKSFLKIPGNYDLAIKGNTLYADSYIDLVALDITDLDNIKETARLKNILTNYNTLGFNMDVDKGLITDWVEKKEVKVYESDCDANVQPWGGMYCGDGIAVLSSESFNKSAAFTPGNGSVSGVGGSMARFTINSDYLYMLDGGDVQAINLTSENNPVAESRTPIAWDMETIFPYKTNLFIGSRSGMHILDISTPSSPVKLSTYDHIRVCDPVVVQDDLAYVTLRSGSTCEGFTNQLEIINIEDIQQPKLLHTYAMTNPHGLGIDGKTLFVCDGDAGLKIFDAADISKIDKNQLAHYDSINAYDVIPFGNTLIMVGIDGIFQYDYSDPKEIKFLSKIEIQHADPQ